MQRRLFCLLVGGVESNMHNPIATAAVVATIVAGSISAVASYLSERRNRMQNIMPTIVFFQDLREGAWVMQNIGPGSAKHVLFTELDGNNYIKHRISLNPVVKNEKILFLSDEFKHCIKLVAEYSDVTGREYYAICEGSETRNPKRHPVGQAKTAKAIPEAQFSDHIRRKYL